MKGATDLLATLISIAIFIAYIAIIDFLIFIMIISIPCLIPAAIGAAIENYFKNRKIRANAWKFRYDSNRYNKYVMHVEEVANRYCRIYNKNKNKVIAKYKKRHPYITIKGKIY